uniref:Uncharacterized protein n=1 Tax=Anguilla anguilla TaxID=7936 RepID=A0A0E9UYQ8_ANGAN
MDRLSQHLASIFSLQSVHLPLCFSPPPH